MSATRLHPTLPVFLFQQGSRCVLYTPPGHLSVVDTVTASLIKNAWNAGNSPEDPTARQVASWLENQASDTITRCEQQRQAPFAPECLLLYLSTQCNLACPYCYARPSASFNGLTLQAPAIDAAARLVAEHCARKAVPFSLVVHGGGEPTLHWELLTSIERSTRQLARRFGLPRSAYLATNGMLSPANAEWAGSHFDQIGLSCDGPPEIQNRQRPFRDGSASSTILERTAGILKSTGTSLNIRTTITPATIDRQAEIVAYLHERLMAKEIRFEPLYSIRGTGNTGFPAEEAPRFVEGFLRAQAEARERGIILNFSGVRLNELHGPYCDVLRHTLHLTPGGQAVACFFATNGQDPINAPFVVGHFDQECGEFMLNQERIFVHRQQAFHLPAACQDCFNAYHCCRGCPEICGIAQNANPADLFRCRVQRQLAQVWIFEAADQLVSDDIQETCAPQISVPERDRINAVLNDVPTAIDTAQILHQWEAVRQHYPLTHQTLPAPIWAERAFDHSGPSAWEFLETLLPRSNSSGAMALYLHLPFCEHRCPFCDCYALAPGKRYIKAQEARYIARLRQEIQAWSRLAPLSTRPVSTLHFGGGTPNYIDRELFESLLDTCRASFTIPETNEWALESTSRLLDEEHLHWLRALNFSRLHVGIQTLEEPLRFTLGRCESGKQALERLSHALRMGFITSVDVLYGLPDQTIAGLVQTLHRLIAVGVHGISLYRFHLSSRNKRFIRQRFDFTPDPLYAYLLFQIAEQILLAHGFHKNHFAHFARPVDRNLYYTHAKRGEDLLALGTTADGVFGDYHYRHPEYSPYLHDTTPAHPALEGGMRETPAERELRPAIQSLMAGNISGSLFTQLQAAPLLERWRSRALLRENPHRDAYTLTANGSWFLACMITELTHWQTRVFS